MIKAREPALGERDGSPTVELSMQTERETVTTMHEHFNAGKPAGG